MAKLANDTAKRLQTKTPGVVDICNPFKRDRVLRNTGAGEVWGIGRSMKVHLEGQKILLLAPNALKSQDTYSRISSGQVKPATYKFYKTSVMRDSYFPESAVTAYV